MKQMERAILLLFERRQLIIIPQRQPFRSWTVFAPFIDSHRAERKNVVPSLFLSLSSRRKGHWGKGEGGEGGWSQWKFKFQLFSSRRETVGTPASPLANRAATLTSTVSTKPNELEWRNTTSFPPRAFIASPSRRPRFHVSFFISRRDHPLLPRCCAFFPLGYTSYAYRDLVNDPIRRRNRVSSPSEVGRWFGLRLVLCDLVRNRIQDRRHDFIRWSNFLKICYWKLFERNG